MSIASSNCGLMMFDDGLLLLLLLLLLFVCLIFSASHAYTMQVRVTCVCAVCSTVEYDTMYWHVRRLLYCELYGETANNHTFSCSMHRFFTAGNRYRSRYVPHLDNTLFTN